MSTGPIPGGITLPTSLEGDLPDVTTSSPEGDGDSCLEKRYWSYFLASSLITFFTGLIAILSYRLIAHFAQFGADRRRTVAGRAEVTTQYGGAGGRGNEEVKVKCTTRLKWYAESWISGQTVTGRILVSRNSTFK